eukprot:3858746-Ditylum_brightwellii.AAC.1
MADSGKEKAATFHNKKYQGGKALPFMDHDFTGYHTMEWYQWETNIQQLLSKGITQLNSANDGGRKVKALPIKLYTGHRKDTNNTFSKNKRQLEVKKILKSANEVKYLLDCSIVNGRNKNVTMIIYVT